MGGKAKLVIDGKKPCFKCGRVLPVSQFGKNTATKSGLRPRCRECDKREKYPVEVTELHTCIGCKELLPHYAFSKQKTRPNGLMGKCRNCVRDATYQQMYDITLAEYNDMLNEQGGGCAICGLPEVWRLLSVDHDHETGKVRGLLCNSCNTTLGHIGDSEVVLTRMVEYLQRYKG